MNLRCCAVLLLAACFLPSVAVAQAAVDTFDDIPRVLDVGRKVVVRGIDGHKTTGRVVEMTPTAFTIAIEDALGTVERELFPRDLVRSINRTDSLWNGLLIGLGTGIVGAELFVRGACGRRGYDDECAAIATGVAVVTFIPGGTIVGALIDKFTGDELIYRAPPRSSLTIAPVVARRAGGIALSLRF
jgi:hypothetical protein